MVSGDGHNVCERLERGRTGDGVDVAAKWGERVLVKVEPQSESQRCVRSAPRDHPTSTGRWMEMRGL